MESKQREEGLTLKSNNNRLSVVTTVRRGVVLCFILRKRGFYFLCCVGVDLLLPMIEGSDQSFEKFETLKAEITIVGQN